jgi:lipopolysaccharide cholinephosphotransferase
MWSEVGKHNEANPLYRVVYRLMSKIPISSVIKHYHKFVNKNNKKDFKHIRFVTFPAPRGTDHNGKIEWYNSFTELAYEGKMLKSITNYHDYLRQKYGDYMTIPPENKRRNNPASKFQFLDDNSNEGNE